MTYNLIHKVFSIKEPGFESLCLEIFNHQYLNNPVYKAFANAVQVRAEEVQTLEQVPFIPVGFFKSHPVCTTTFEPEAIFESSGTTGTVNSRHYIKDLAIYRKSFMTGFEAFYGPPDEWCIIGLLPSYLERKNASLVVMVDALIRSSGHAQSGFYLYEFKKLAETLKSLERQQQKTLLIGVTFALMDFAEQFPLELHHTIVMETGGMKGRRKEMTRPEVHDFLKSRFALPAVHAEYGMTEILSQAYSPGNGLFHTPPWMKLVIREEDDPLTVKSASGLRDPDQAISGVINVIDLANIHSCSFIATDDLGKVYRDGSFEVLGRIDNSDIRGCSLLVAQDGAPGSLNGLC